MDRCPVCPKPRPEVARRSAGGGGNVAGDKEKGASMSEAKAEREFLRHTLATLAYRGGRAIRGAKPGFADFQASDARTPGQILAHIGDLLEWGLSIAEGQQKWQDSEQMDWEEQGKRFHAALEAFDAYLASDS